MKSEWVASHQKAGSSDHPAKDEEEREANSTAKAEGEKGRKPKKRKRKGVTRYFPIPNVILFQAFMCVLVAMIAGDIGRNFIWWVC